LGLDAFDVSVISTKNAINVLKNLQLQRSILVVTNNAVDIMKSYRNIPSVDIVDAAYVSVFDLLKAKKVLFIGDALEKVVEIVKRKK
jgi:large subunit ribosomal protein L4